MLDDPDRLRRLASGIRRMAMQRSLADLAEVSAQACVDLLNAERGRCLFHDADEASLWVEGTHGRDESRWSTEHGLAGVVAKAGEARVLERASAAASYVSSIDDPDGRGDERLLAQPVHGHDGGTEAVVVLARAAHQPPFDEDDAAWMRHWAQQAAPIFHTHVLEYLADEVRPTAGGGIFRDAAFVGGTPDSERGLALPRAPAWTRWAHAIGLAFVAALVAFVCVARVREYAGGVGVVVMAGNLEVNAVEPGVVESVEVRSGDCVRAGDVLARLHASSERADVDRLQREHDALLTARLLDPADRGLEDRVAAARIELSRAQARLRAKEITASVAGCVRDVRLVAGRAIAAGQTLATLALPERAPRIWAFVPGRYAPSLRPGQDLRLELDGFARSALHLRVDAVATDVLGPAEMQRVVGPQLADAIAMQGPMVRVEAQLSSATFEADGKAYPLSDGMVGSVEIPVRDTSALFAIFPSLEGALGDE